MIWNLISQLRAGADVQYVLPGILFTLIVVLFSLSFHEMSHAYIAYKLGDPTAHSLGRITLAPNKHLDLIGTISMLLFGFGWAKPVPVNARYFKKPKRDMALTSIAGPISNLLIAFIALLLLKITAALAPSTANIFYFDYLSSGAISQEYLIEYSMLDKVLGLISVLLYYFHIMNLYLAIFNLIPIPPLDGSRLLFIFLPDKLYFGLMKYERIIMLVLLGLLWTGLISNPLSIVCGFISSSMNGLISLIPGLSGGII